MEKGVNLSMTKSLAEFDSLLEKTIEAVSIKELAVTHEFDDAEIEVVQPEWQFQVGKYVKIVNDNEDDETAYFWIGHGWEERKKRKSVIWLEFDARTCPEKYWNKLNDLIGTSGKYYSDIDFEFSQVYMNAWVQFYLKEEYVQKFYDENIDLNEQKEILVGFISEVLSKIDINFDNNDTPLVSTEKRKKAPTPQERDNVMRLYKKGWSIEEISETLDLGKSEVELIIEISG